MNFFPRRHNTFNVLNTLKEEIARMALDLTNLSQDVQALTAAVIENTTAVTAAVTDLQSLSAALQQALANVTDPAVQQELADIQGKIEAQTNALQAASANLGAAVAANHV